MDLRAQHGHLNAGAMGTEQGDQLIWANRADFIESSGYVKTLVYAESGRYAGLYQGGITPTALPATGPHGGPDPAASALGSFLQFKIACLEGPDGGRFNFWESTGDTPVESLAPGESSPKLWPLSESDGSADADPFGHIHGRRFTATKPGTYKIAFTAVDTSIHGADDGPIHTPSEPLSIWFQAGVNIVMVEPDEEEGHDHIFFGAQAGFSWQVEYSPVLGPEADWQPAGNRIVGGDYFVEVIHDLRPGRQRFYRVQGMPIIP